MKKSEIIGTWDLINHGKIKNGIFTKSGDNVSGRLLYTDSDHMSVIISFKKNSLEAKDMIAYSGKYSIIGSQIIHHVDISNRSEFLGKDEVRNCEFKNKYLILRTNPENGQYFEITWGNKS